MKIIIGGDFYIPAEKTELATRDLHKPWGEVLELFKDSDYRIINLEGPVTDAIEPIHKTGPHLRLSPEVIGLIKFAGVDMVTMANNHINDYGDQGVMNTIDNCRNIGIETAGAGSNLKNARCIKYIAENNAKIAIINIAENEWNGATDDHAGSNPMDIIDNVMSIQEARMKADFVVLIIHGGHELNTYPSPRMVKQYRFYAKQGASAIISHHSHCISGYEVFEGVPIFFGLGNLIMPIKPGDKSWTTGMLVQLDFHNDHNIDFRYFPYSFSDKEFTLRLLVDEELKSFKEEIHTINSVISDELLLARKFTESVVSKDEYYLASIYLHPVLLKRRVYRILKFARLTRWFYTRTQISNLLNYVSQ